MPKKSPHVRAVFYKLVRCIYRVLRFFYRKLKQGYGVDVLNIKIPFANKTIKAFLYPLVKRGFNMKPLKSNPLSEWRGQAEDYICLVRIVGNDIPDVDDEDLSYKNLKYILENENEFPGVHKVFLVNRLVSQHQSEKIKKLLAFHGKLYFEIPFDAEEYVKIPLIDESSSMGLSVDKKGGSRYEELCSRVASRVSRCAYLLNYIGAKNHSLQCSNNGGFQWVLPWDGNCFLSDSQFLSIKRRLDLSKGDAEKFWVPMRRCLDALDIISPSSASLASKEEECAAQIVLKVSPGCKFDLDEIYGGIPKGAVLLRNSISVSLEAWLHERPWKDVDFSREKACSLEDLKEPQSSSDATASSAEEIYSRVTSIVNFIDESFEFSKNRLSTKNEIDFQYYHQAKKDVRLSSESLISVNSSFDKVYIVSLEDDLEKRLKLGFQLRSLGIDYEWFSAVNGYEGQPLLEYQEYTKRPLGEMSHFIEGCDYELNRGSKLIESPGAVGYIYTYISIIKDAKNKGFKKILILEDDVILCDGFEQRFNRFITSISENWKILHFGASQYEWDGINVSGALKNGFYTPSLNKTKGSFAIGLNESIFDELIENLLHLDSPFDNFPVGYLYEKYSEACFVSYPYLAIPDVATSRIRGGRSQYSHSNRVRWWVSDFKYPAQKPCVGIFLKSRLNLKHLDCRVNPDLPFVVNYFFLSENGISPLHRKEFLPDNYFVEPIELEAYEFFSLTIDCLLEVDPELPLTEKLITSVVVDSFSGGPLKKGFKEISLRHVRRVPGRVSVVIPTYKRSEHLQRAMISVLEQGYEDLELLVVDDNGAESPFSDETAQVVDECASRYPWRKVQLIQHVKNANGAAARNTGILASSGEYICFLDDDDIYLPGRISNSIQELANSSGEIGAVYCGFLGWNSRKLNLERFKDGDLTKEIFKLEYRKHYLHTNTATYRASAILAVNGFDESYRRHQDLEFNIRFFERYQMATVKEALVRLAPEKSSVDNKLYGVEMLKLKRKFLTDFEYLILNFSKSDQDAIYNAHCQEVVRYAAGEKDESSIFDYIRGVNSTSANMIVN